MNGWMFRVSVPWWKIISSHESEYSQSVDSDDTISGMLPPFSLQLINGSFNPISPLCYSSCPTTSIFSVLSTPKLLISQIRWQFVDKDTGVNISLDLIDILLSHVAKYAKSRHVEYWQSYWVFFVVPNSPSLFSAVPPRRDPHCSRHPPSWGFLTRERISYNACIWRAHNVRWTSTDQMN